MCLCLAAGWCGCVCVYVSFRLYVFVCVSVRVHTGVFKRHLKCICFVNNTEYLFYEAADPGVIMLSVATHPRKAGRLLFYLQARNKYYGN